MSNLAAQIIVGLILLGSLTIVTFILNSFINDIFKGWDKRKFAKSLKKSLIHSQPSWDEIKNIGYVSVNG